MTGAHIDLFSGVGMMSLAIEASGYKTVVTAEVDPFCQSVLRRRFPNALAHLTDVRHVTARLAGDDLPRPLIVSGGFPCQDVAAPSSTQSGLRGSRSGLWTEFARVIREFHPDLVLIENSPMLRRRGLDVIAAALVERGYDFRWDCIPASAVGAPHRRDRIWIVAWPSERAPWCTSLPLHYPRSGRVTEGRYGITKPLYTVRESAKVPTLGRMYPTLTLSDGTGGPGRTPKRTGGPNLRTVMNELEGNGRVNPMWGEWLMGLPLGWTDPTVPNGQLIPHPGWNDEPANVPRTVDHREPSRAKRIKALGNGLVPQVAQRALFELSPEADNG